MERRKFIHYKNIQETYGEEALVDVESGVVIYNGDDYHNKIASYIEGFLKGLDYIGAEYELEVVYINEEECNALPYDLNFYYEDEVNEHTNTNYVVDYSCNGMNEKDDDEIELEHTRKSDDEDDFEIDDISAFLAGVYDKEDGTKELFQRDDKRDCLTGKYIAYIDGCTYPFFAATLEIALMSVWNYEGELFFFNMDGLEEFMFSCHEPIDVNNAALNQFGIGQRETNEELELYNLQSNKKITIDDDDYIVFF